MVKLGRIGYGFGPEVLRWREDMGVLLYLIVLAYGLAQLAVGYMGIEVMVGAGWAVAALIGCFFFRFMLPITIGSFFGATEVLGWHWGLALIFAAPGLLFLVPAVLSSVFDRS